MTRRIPLSRIRNIGIIAHVDAGKTTLTERVLLLTGAIHKAGDVHHGNTTTDSHAIEKKRGVTIQSAAVTCRWRDHEIHVIDTPGHVDFAVEVERSLRVLDGAVVVLDGVAGVEPQTESVWRRADKRRLARIAFVNKLDRAGADFDRCVAELRERLGAEALVVALPWFERVDGNDAFVGTFDVVARRALRFVEGRAGFEEHAVPAASAQLVEETRAALVTALADVDEHVLAAVVDGKDVDAPAIVYALRRATIEHAFVPVLCGAAYKTKGIEPLLDAVLAFLPSPADLRGDDDAMKNGGDDDPLLATAFKIVHDAFGAMTLVRLHRGALHKGDAVVSARTDKRVRVGRIVELFADDKRDVDAVYAGDIAGLPGLALATGDTLCAPDAVVALESFAFDAPVLSKSIEPAHKSDRDTFAKALGRLLAEDPSLAVKTDDETGETVLSGMGELHLDVAVEKLKTDHGVDVKTGKPRVAYKETVTQLVEHELVWRKQGGGPGQFAKVRLRLSPNERGKGFAFVDETKGGSVPREFIPAVESGVEAALARGVVHGFPVVDVVVALLDGASHEVDSSELAFKNCAQACFLEAARRANPALLEPLMEVVVTVVEERVGDVIGDLLRRRAVIEGVDAAPASVHERVVRANVPLAEMFGYADDLRGKTQGRGTFTMRFCKHALVPSGVAARISSSSSSSSSS